MVRELAAEGMTMVIATHEMAFAREVANRVCFLDAGVILEQGPPEQIFHDPAGAAHPAVSAADHRGRPHAGHMSKSRLETFCDGVFAIAITLLVLDLRVPEVGTGSLADALWHEWPSVVAFVVSFMLIGIMWVNHHTLMRHFEFVDRAFLFINLAFLMVVAFVPFPTGVVAESLKAPRTDANLTTAALFYGLTSLVLALMFNAVWHYGRLRLMSESADPPSVGHHPHLHGRAGAVRAGDPGGLHQSVRVPGDATPCSRPRSSSTARCSPGVRPRLRRCVHTSWSSRPRTCGWCRL